MSETTRGSEQTLSGALYLAFELGNAEWKLGFTTGLGQSPRQRTIDAKQVAAATTRFVTWVNGRSARHVPNLNLTNMPNCGIKVATESKKATSTEARALVMQILYLLLPVILIVILGQLLIGIKEPVTVGRDPG